MRITEQTLNDLRERIRPYLKDTRYLHTLEVEKEVIRIGELYCPEKIPALRVSALLHDITKAADYEKQLQFCEEFGIILSESDFASPKVLHAVTAPEIVKRDFPEFADEEILSGIRWHTTGRDGMTVFEAAVYLADFIEPTRTFEDCISLRNVFYNSMPEESDFLAMTVHLCKTMVYSFDLTVENLIADGEPIGIDTVGARNCFLRRLEALTKA